MAPVGKLSIRPIQFGRSLEAQYVRVRDAVLWERPSHISQLQHVWSAHPRRGHGRTSQRSRALGEYASDPG